MTIIQGTFGAPLKGSLTNAATDTYTLTAATGGIVTLTFAHPNGPGATGASIQLQLLDFLGNVIVTQTVRGNAVFNTTVPAGGDYYLKVMDGDPYTNNDGGTYTVTPALANTPGTTYDGGTNNSTATAIASALSAPIAGSINPSDTDVFKVHADAGGVLTLDFVHPNGAGTSGASINIDVLDSAGNIVAGTHGVRGNTTLVTSVATAGDYYLQVSDGDVYTSNDGGIYTLTPTLATKAGVTYDGAANNNTATAVSSPMAAPIVGSINPSDTDMFKVHADAGGVLTLDFVHPNGAGSTGASINIDVLDTAGNIVASTHGVRGNTTLLTTVATAGDYYLQVSDGDTYTNNDGGLYTLTPTLATKAGATYDGAANNSTATALASAPGAPIIGSINPSDTDMFKVHTDAGGVLTLDFAHPNGAGSTGASINIDVLDIAGNIVASSLGVRGNTTLVTTVANAGDYYIKVSDGDTYTSNDGGIYTLTPTLLTNASAVYDGASNNSAGSALAAPLGTLVYGSVNPSDSDYFKFSASSGGTLTVGFSHPAGAVSNGAAIAVAIVDAAGKTVFSTTERGNDLFSVTLPGGGDYYLKVSDGDVYTGNDGGVYSVMTGLATAPANGMTGTAGADSYTSLSGNDVINGGGGRDTVIYHGNSSDYQISAAAVGSNVTDKLGRDGADTLFNVERLQFADKMVALDLDGVAGQAYRLYQAAFDRAPDSAGLGYWIAQMDKGATLNTVASAFISSAEFQQAYGSGPGNQAMVAKFYANVLHRAADPAGQAYWVSVLDTHASDAAGVLAAFSASAENVAQVIGSIAHGIGYTPYG